jgi:hypothetical protein
MVYNVKNLANIVGVRPGHDGTQIFISNAGGTTGVIYTVPANMVLLLNWYEWIIERVAGVGQCSVVIFTTGYASNVQIVEVRNAAGISLAGSGSFPIPLEIPAGSFFYVYGGPLGSWVQFSIHGILFPAIGRGL